MRGSCAHGVRHTITERRVSSLRMAASHLLLQVNSPHFSMREALPGDRIGRVFLSRALLLREACGPRARARRARVSSIHSFISWALSAAWVATTSRPVRGLICVSRAARMRLYTVSAVWAICFSILCPVILSARRYLFTSIYRSIGGTPVSRSKATLGVRLYAPVTLRRHSF
jgi:hypothetical protein